LPSRPQLVVEAGLAVVVLVATTLSAYRPWGRTSYGRRKLRQQRGQKEPREYIRFTRISSRLIVAFDAPAFWRWAV
jgi:hypothetical protein